ncbi:hypothetical protein [Spirosoma flavum]|uniref:Uncharacterized protein n=1 Tax=Spirosoma flavum TaxID=2048557 RepID=A0ABW6AKN1_9BACT
MFIVKFLGGIIVFMVCMYFILLFKNRMPENRQHLLLKDPAKSVQDSMILWRKICESVEAKTFMNCYVRASDSTLQFNGESIGKIDSVSVSNKAFQNMEKDDVVKLLSLIKFLKRNSITGVFHDTSIGFWLYVYKDDIYYSTTQGVRNIYIWDTPKDTLEPAFVHFFKIFDRKDRMVLVGLNDLQHK